MAPRGHVMCMVTQERSSMAAPITANITTTPVEIFEEGGGADTPFQMA